MTEIKEMSLARLWTVHDHVLRLYRTGIGQPPENGEATLLHLKAELAHRILKHCTLCPHRCGVDRTSGERGICGLGTEAMVAEHFVHIGEEAVVNPSLMINLAGCGLRCLYCQQGDLLNPGRIDGDHLDESFWGRIDFNGARSLSLAGGNPDESAAAILRFLLSAPEDWVLPVVWNCHGFAAPETLALLEGAVDAWLPDYKYGSSLCGEKFSGVSRYPVVAREAITGMLTQDVPVIVRILILPGHSQCCHFPVLETLAGMANPEKLLVSVRGQYCPDGHIQSCDSAMNRRVMEKEIVEIKDKAEALGLTLASA